MGVLFTLRVGPTTAELHWLIRSRRNGDVRRPTSFSGGGDDRNDVEIVALMKLLNDQLPILVCPFHADFFHEPHEVRLGEALLTRRLRQEEKGDQLFQSQGCHGALLKRPSDMLMTTTRRKSRNKTA